MAYLSLLFALTLPWLGGYLWLSILEGRFSHTRSTVYLRLGYGLFIGYAAVQGLVLACNTIFGQILFIPILCCLVLLTLLGAFIQFRSRTLPATNNTSAPSSPLYRLLIWLLLGWITLHLVLVAVEILHRPVFPWDAWVSWIYRAKAWFLHSQVLAMDDPSQWFRGRGEALYNVAGNQYPSFVPALALWSTLALGFWSETLVNLPVLFCGIALALAFFGQCREFGMPTWLAALASYLLLSIPLVGTHLALAGKADIWMSGFTGLGFVALLHGASLGQRFHIFLGLGMVTLGIATKMEGLVWFLAALIALALATRPRTSVLVLVILAGLSALAALFGVTYLELPMLGGIGFAVGHVHVPLLGSYALKTFELWDDYLDNFFKNGTWHLLWTFMLLAIIALLRIPAGSIRRSLVAFYLLVLAAQIFIFEGTEAGNWAEDWTAINRLPLHFAPPLIFSIAILASVFIRKEQATPRLAGPSVATPSIATLLTGPAAALAICLLSVGIFLAIAYSGNTGSAQTFFAKDMSIVVGGGRLAGNVGMIENFDNNIAILSSGPVQLNTQQLQLLQLDTRGENQQPVKFFWRNGTNPEDLHSIEVAGLGTRMVNLDELPQWQGQANEIGLIIFAGGGAALEFHGLELSAHSATAQARKLLHDWGELSLWTQKSVNWLPAGSLHSSLPLPLLMSAWLLLAVLMASWLPARHNGGFASVLLCAVIAWAVLDIRWTINSLNQAAVTRHDYPPVTASHLDYGDDWSTLETVQAIRHHIEGDGHRTVIMGEDETMNFQVLRAKYHALPAATYVHEGQLQTLPAGIGDHVLILRKRYTDPNYASPTAKDFVQSIQQHSRRRARVVWENQDALLLRIDPRRRRGRD